ncbi:benenodin family lasso peptide [uncultured Sphingomonas sp.]|nr:benenodin family lasso peptide [uncultured Sphingomonas sp.]
MKENEAPDDEVIELGVATVETKGTAKIDQDPSGGQLRFVMGIAQD